MNTKVVNNNNPQGKPAPKGYRAGWIQRMAGAKQRKAAVTAALTVFGTKVMAQGTLPTTAPPTRGGTTGNYIEMMQNYAYDIFIFLGLALATVAFFAVTKNVISAYGEVQDGKGSWSQVGMQFGVGVLLLVFVVFLLTEAAAIL